MIYVHELLCITGSWHGALGVVIEVKEQKNKKHNKALSPTENSPGKLNSAPTFFCLWKWDCPPARSFTGKRNSKDCKLWARLKERLGRDVHCDTHTHKIKNTDWYSRWDMSNSFLDYSKPVLFYYWRLPERSKLNVACPGNKKSVPKKLLNSCSLVNFLEKMKNLMKVATLLKIQVGMRYNPVYMDYFEQCLNVCFFPKLCLETDKKKSLWSTALISDLWKKI